jgi:hypothetical protein
MAYEGNWREISEFLEWYEAAETWKKEFGVFEYIEADENGKDPTGRSSSYDEKYVWTLQSWDTDFIEPGRGEGFGSSGGVEGWYISKEPWTETNKPTIEALKIISCITCGEGELADPEDCETCDYEGTIWMRLEDTGWKI